MKLRGLFLSTILLTFVLANLTVFAQQTELTISKDAPMRIHLGLESKQIGTLKKGTLVEGLAQTGLTYQVRTKNGNVGWVEYDYFQESKELVIEPFGDREVSFFKSLHEGNILTSGQDKIRDFEAGEVVTYLEGLELKGFIKVKDASGEIGYVDWHRARPHIEDLVPDFEQLDFVVILQSDFEQNYLNGSLDSFVEYVGPPDSKILDENGNGFCFYRKLFLVKDGDRYGDLTFNLENNNITSFSFEEGPIPFWVEKMPLAKWMRGLGFGVKFQRMQGYDLFPSTGEMGFLKKWGWRILWIITLFIFFTIPYHLSKPFVNIYGGTKALPKGLAKALATLTAFAFIYFYYLFVGIHMSHDQHWLFAGTAVLLAIYAMVVISRKIGYNRCPNPECRSWKESEFMGSDVVGKTHVTEHKHKNIYRGTRETSTEIIKEYDRHHYTEESTELEIDDHMECTICGTTWEVRRGKTVKGHV